MDDTVQLLTLTLAAVVVFLAVTLRRAIRNAAVPSPIPPTIQVTDPDVARCMLVDHADVFANRPLAPFPVDYDAGHRRPSYSINIVPHGPLWRALRCNLSSGVLHPSYLAAGAVAPLQRDAVDALIAGLSAEVKAGGGGDTVVVLRDALHTAVFAIAVRMCFGDGVVGVRERRAMQDTLHEFFDNIVEAGGLAAASRLARLRRWRWWQHFGTTFHRLIELFLPLIAARQRRRRSQVTGDDGDGSVVHRPYVDSLLDLRVPVVVDDDDDMDDSGKRRPLTDHEMASLVWEFLSASTETVVSSIEWTIAHLVADPEVQEKLHQELAGVSDDESLRDMPYLRAVIRESLRLRPPVPFIVRDVDAKDVAAAVAGGAAMAAAADGGTVVRFMLMVGDVGRDGKAWTEPGEFRPERFLAGGEGEGVGLVPGPTKMRMMPFGAGRRYCPGVGLGTMHIRCFLSALVREFEWAPPVEGGDVDMTELDGFFKVMKTPLPARITPRTQIN